MTYSAEAREILESMGDYSGRGYSDDTLEILRSLESGAPVAAPPPRTDRTWGESFSDLGASFGRGAGGLVEGAGTLYGLATGDMDNAARRLGNETSEYWQGQKSEGLIAAERERAAKVNAAEGEWSKFGTALKETATNPALATSFLAEQVPMTVGPGAIGRVATAAKGVAAGTAAAVGSGAALQGADVAGDTYDEAKKLAFANAVAKGMSPEEAEGEALMAARKAGAGAAAVSVATQFVPGGRSIERALAGATERVGSRVTGAVKSGAGEILQEVPEEVGGKMASNLSLQSLDPTIDTMRGTGETAAMAIMGAGPTGALFGAAEPAKPDVKPKPTPADAVRDIMGAKTIDETILAAERALSGDATPPPPPPVAPVGDAPLNESEIAAVQRMEAESRVLPSETQRALDRPLAYTPPVDGAVDNAPPAPAGPVGNEIEFDRPGAAAMLDPAKRPRDELAAELQREPAPLNPPAIIATPGAQPNPDAKISVPGTPTTSQQYGDALAKQQRGELLSTYEKTLVDNPPAAKAIVVGGKDYGDVSQMTDKELHAVGKQTRSEDTRAAVTAEQSKRAQPLASVAPKATSTLPRPTATPEWREEQRRGYAETVGKGPRQDNDASKVKILDERIAKLRAGELDPAIEESGKSFGLTKAEMIERQLVTAEAHREAIFGRSKPLASVSKTSKQETSNEQAPSDQPAGRGAVNEPGLRTDQVPAGPAGAAAGARASSPQGEAQSREVGPRYVARGAGRNWAVIDTTTDTEVRSGIGSEVAATTMAAMKNKGGEAEAPPPTPGPRSESAEDAGQNRQNTPSPQRAQALASKAPTEEDTIPWDEVDPDNLPEPRTMGTGRIVGAPPGRDTPAARETLVKELLAQAEDPLAVPERSAQWYENSGAAIARLTRGDKKLADKVARLFALYSQGNSVTGNTTATIKSLVQIARGETPAAGRFPSATKKTVEALLAAPEVSGSIKGVNHKLLSFYRNLADPALGQDRHPDAVTLDRWMMRIFGYKFGETAGEGGSKNLSATQYAYAKDLMARLTTAYNKKHGTSYKPRNLQALLWTYVKNSGKKGEHEAKVHELDMAAKSVEREAAKGDKSALSVMREARAKKAELGEFKPEIADFGTVLDRSSATLTWETIPGKGTGILPGIHNATEAQKREFTIAMHKALLDAKGNNQLFEKLSLVPLYNEEVSSGTFEGAVSPNIVSRLVLEGGLSTPDDKTANLAADLLGLVYSQDAVPWHAPDPNGKVLGIDLQIADAPSDPGFDESLYAEVGAALPGAEYTKVGEGRYRFLNFTSLTDQQFADKLMAAVEPMTSFGAAEVVRFKARSAYQTGGENGQDYRSRIREAGRSDLLQWADDRRAALQEIYSDFAERYGWDEGTARTEEAEAAPEVDRGVPAADLRALVARVTEKWKNAPDITVAARVSDLPEDLREWVRTNGEDSIEGLYDPETGSVYLIAENIGSQDRAEFVLAHEALGHGGLRALLGKSLDPILRSIYEGNKSVREAATKLRAARGGMRLTVERATEEVLADMAGEGRAKELKGWEKIVKAVREFLFALGLKRSWDDAAVERLVAAAGTAITEGVDPIALGEGAQREPVAAEAAPMWYSELSRKIAETKTEVMPAPQWRAYINNLTTKGVKKDEIVWSGIEEFLATREGKVSKEDILAYLNANGVKVEETVLKRTEARPMNAEERAEIERHIADMERRLEDVTAQLDVATDQFHEADKTLDETGWSEEYKYLQRHWPMSMEKALNDEQKTMILEGFAKNNGFDLDKVRAAHKILFDVEKTTKIEEAGEARERAQKTMDDLIDRADALTNNIASEKYKLDQKVGGRDETKFAGYQAIKGLKNYRELLLTLPQSITDTSFRESHWDQPNVLAHVRVAEGVSADGKPVLVVQEIQSDWAQQGREQGFALTPGERERFEDLNEMSTDDLRESGQLDEFIELENRLKEGVPAAPFVKKTEAWTALALKRIIRMAVDEGFDHVVWPTGKQHVDLYGGRLRNAVDQIQWEKTPEGVHLVGVKGEGRGVKREVVNTRYSENELTAAIGKAMADRIREDSNQTGVIEGDNITIDDTGMSMSYDVIVPNVANDVLKKLGGGRVKEIEIQRPGYEDLDEVWFEVRKREGVPASRSWIVVVKRRGRGFAPVDSVGGFSSHGQASAYAQMLQAREIKKRPETLTQLGFDITPEMKAKVVGGIPLFSARAPVAGSRGLAGLLGAMQGSMTKDDEVKSSAGMKRPSQLLQALAADDDSFQFGQSNSRDWDTIVREMGLDGIKAVHKATSAKYNRMDIILNDVTTQVPLYDSSTDEGGNPAAPRNAVAHVMFGTDKMREWEPDSKARPVVWVDTSGLTAGKSGKQVYQLISTWAANNGYTFIPDPAGLSPKAVEARVANGLSSAMRLGTTKYQWPPAPRDVNPMYDWTIPFWVTKLEKDWKIVDEIGDAADQHNMRLLVEAQLAIINGKLKAAKIVDDEVGRIDNLSSIEYNFDSEKIVYKDSGEPVPRAALDRLAEALVPAGLKVSGGRGKGPRPGDDVSDGSGPSATGEAEAGVPSARGARATLVRGVILQSALELSPRDVERLSDSLRNNQRPAAGTAREGLLASVAPKWVQEGSPELQSAASKIDTYSPATPIGEKLGEMKKVWKDRAIQKLFDSFAPLKKLSPRAYVLARMVKSADSSLEASLLYGKPKIADEGYIYGDLDKKGFLGHLQDLQGEHDRFLMWVAGNRAERLAGEDRENLFSRPEIEAMKGLIAGKMPDGTSRPQAYAKAAEQMRLYNKSVLDIAEKTGLIDGESRRLWEHDFYVPFFRVADEDGKIDGPSQIKGLLRQKAFEKLKGGQENLGDLLDNVLSNWSHLLSASLANQAAVASLKAAEKVGIAEKIVGVPEHLARDQSNAYAMEGGRKVYYNVTDPFVLEALSSMESASFKGLPMEMLGKAKHYLTLGVTASPTFRIRNLMRDSISAVAQNDLSYNALKNVAQGFKGASRKSDQYAQAMFNGAIIRFGQTTDGKHAEHAKRLIMSGVKDQTILDTKTKVRDALGKVWDEYQEFGDKMENVNRIARYQQGLDRGESPLDAAFAARDMLDFGLQGSSTAVRFLTQIVPFMNARLQGLYRLGRSAKEHPGRFAAVSTTAALASIALLMAYKDDDDWKKRADWDRDNFWWFKLGNTAYRIPKPFEIGALATLAERSWEMMVSEEMTGKRMGERVMAMLGDTLALNPTPQLFKPMMEIYYDRDSFTGREIEGRRLEGLSKPERANSYTSMAARVLGKAGDKTGLSPVQIDHLIRGYFGWLGTHIAQVGDVVAEPFLATPKPARKLQDVFVVGDFAEKLPGSRSRYVEEFWKQSKVVHEVMNDIKRAREVGDLDKVTRILSERGDAAELAKVYQRAEGTMGEVNRQIRVVEGMKDIPAEAKRQRIDELREQQHLLTKSIEAYRLERRRVRSGTAGR